MKKQPSPPDQKEQIERNLHLAKEYWMRIHPYIKGRPLRGAELCVACNAHDRLRRAWQDAGQWNGTEAGKSSPVCPESVAELDSPEFREPEALFRDEKLTPSILAGIAAPLMQKRAENLPPVAIIGLAHELLLAAERYIEELPKRGTTAIDDFQFVTVAEIEQSNKPSSGCLPLLPPTGQKHKGGELETPLTTAAIRRAIQRYREKHALLLNEEQFVREQKQDAELAKRGTIGPIDTLGYNDWKSAQQEDPNSILLQDLCELRWERFSELSETRQRAALKRATKTGRKRDAKLAKPVTATTAQVFVGRPEVRKKTVNKFS